jgi:pyruvate kinase
VQKEIVRKSHAAGKPVVVATQMLDSMQKNPRPTRAECTDVSNAVFDGADCVMLSGESAKGKYPVQSVATMKRIVDEAVTYLNGKHVDLLPGATRLYDMGVSRRVFQPLPVGNKESVAASVADMAARLDVACVIVLCETGNLARSLSKFRPSAPVVCFSKNAKEARLLQIHYGLVPVVGSPALGAAEPLDKRVDAAILQAKAIGLCKKDDRIIVIGGRPKVFGLHIANVL